MWLVDTVLQPPLASDWLLEASPLHLYFSVYNMMLVNLVPHKVDTICALFVRMSRCVSDLSSLSFAADFVRGFPVFVLPLCLFALQISLKLICFRIHGPVSHLGPYFDVLFYVSLLCIMQTRTCHFHQVCSCVTVTFIFLLFCIFFIMCVLICDWFPYRNTQ